MFLSNFDFSSQKWYTKICMIGIPVLFCETITYPILRVQSFLTASGKPAITNTQRHEMEYYLRTMLKQQGFPKIYNGMRYSFDHSLTTLLVRFFTFQQLMSRCEENLKEWQLVGSILASYTLSTIVGQPSFNYRTMSSFLPINRFRQDEVRQKMLKLNQWKMLKTGLFQAILTNNFLAVAEFYLFINLRAYLKSQSEYAEIIPAFLTTLITTVITHPIHQFRLITTFNQFCQTNQRIAPKWNFNGLLPAIFRRTVYNTLLFASYTYILKQRDAQLIEGSFEKRQLHQNIQKFREGMTRFDNDNQIGIEEQKEKAKKGISKILGLDKVQKD